jgi:hypothetical protein
MAGPEAAEGIDDGDQNALEPVRLCRKGPAVSIWFLLDGEFADHPLVGRLSLHDSLVDLVSGPGSPKAEHVGVV